MAKVLIGFMGSGKSTVGRLLDPNFYDMDQMIVDRIGMSISDYFAKEGEAAFREQESNLLAELLEQENAVISTGGGIVTNPKNRELLAKNPENIFLEVSFEEVYDRIKNDTGAKRPLFENNTKEAFKEIFDGRQAIYHEVATKVISVDQKTPEEIVKEILA